MMLSTTLVLLVSGTGLRVSAAPRPVTCTAVADVSKQDLKSPGPALARSGPYTVRLSSNGAALLVAVEPKDRHEAQPDKKSTAPVDKVLLRSPYKTEATALPSGVHVHGDAAVAEFDLAAVQALPAGPFNVVITTSYGERSCRITPRQRTELVHSE